MIKKAPVLGVLGQQQVEPTVFRTDAIYWFNPHERRANKNCY